MHTKTFREVKRKDAMKDRRQEDRQLRASNLQAELLCKPELQQEM